MRISHGLLLLLVWPFGSATERVRTLRRHGSQSPPLVAAANPESIDARNANDATLLFEDGRARLQAGKYGTARLAFETLIAVYPESPLVADAVLAARDAARLEQAQSPVIRSLRFENFEGVKIQDILARFEEREVGLEVAQSYDARTLERAKTVLAEFLAESGVATARVRVDTRELPPRSVEITFRLDKR